MLFLVFTVNATVDWVNPGLTSIPDSLPTVHSSEDWQAAFGFHNEPVRANNIVAQPTVTNVAVGPINSEEFAEKEVFQNRQFSAMNENSNSIVSNLLMNSSTSKFMADFQQNSLHRKLAIQVYLLTHNYLQFNHDLFIHNCKLVLKYK